MEEQKLNERDRLLEQVVCKLKAAGRVAEDVQAAQVSVINMNEIMESAGCDWAHVRDRIRAGSADFLRACLEDEDTLIPCGDGFLIVFDTDDLQKIQSRCRDLQEMLTAFYAGEEGLQRLKARVDQKRFQDVDVQSIAQVEPPRRAPSRVFGDHIIAFAPIWSVKAKLTGCYFLGPTRQQEGRVAHCYDADYHETGENTGEVYSALDMEILDIALTTLRERQRRGVKGIIGACVHISTLRNRTTRAEYLRRLAEAQDDAEYLIVKVAEIARGVPLSTLVDLTGQIRRGVRHVGLEFHYTERTITRLNETGAWSAGFRLPPSASANSFYTELLSRWTQNVHREHIRLFVDGFENPRLLQEAARDGVDFASSEIFWPSVQEAGEVVPSDMPLLR